MMDNLLYFSYGRTPHEDELVYAALSALNTSGRSRFRIVVCTDNPKLASDLPVEREIVSDEVLKNWAGPFNFNHRKKIFAVQHVLKKYGGRVIYCDSDTYFLKSPRKLFSRVGAGRTLLHIAEDRLDAPCGVQLAECIRSHSWKSLKGSWVIPPDTQTFNAGVIGLHESDIALLDEVIYLTDQVYSNVQLPTVEQLAFSVCFSQRTRCRQSYDALHHYWNIRDRAKFHQHLSRVVHDGAISNEEKFRRLTPYRPVQKLEYRFQSSAGKVKYGIRRGLSRVAELLGVKDRLQAFLQRRFHA